MESIENSQARAKCRRIPNRTAFTHCRTLHGSVLVQHGVASSRRADVEEFIRNEFLEHFGANVREFMPRLIALEEPRGEVRAVAGYRSAAAERLFLETYTDQPIERVIAERLGVDVPRTSIVEVGNLACRSARAAMEIVTALIPVFLHAGFAWVVFTGADTVRNVFRRLDLVPHALCAADKTRLGAAQHEWGTYYEHNPLVMAGRIVEGLAAIDRMWRVQ